MIEKSKNIIDFFLKGFQPKPILTVTEWAEKHRILTMSAEKGKYNASRTPYFIDIMNELSEHSTTQQVIVVASAQVGKTETGNNFLGYIIDRMGGYCLSVQPTLNEAVKFNNLRVTPMIDANPDLKRKFLKNELDSKRKKDNAQQKDFEGGSIVFGNASSANSMSSLPAQFLFLDEVDRYESDAANGHPFDLAVKRTETFNNKKIFAISTPTLLQTSRIWREYEKGDQNHYMMTCPTCRYDELEFTQDNFHFVEEDNEITDAYFCCPICKSKIEEKQKAKLILEGRWEPTNFGQKRVKSYYINQAYSLISSSGWKGIAQEIHNTNKSNDIEKKKTLQNLVWGLPYDDSIKTEDAGKLLEKYIEIDDKYDLNELIDDIAYLNLTVDTQDNRFVCLTTAYSKNGERYVLRYDEIFFNNDIEDAFSKVIELSYIRYFYQNDKKKYMKAKTILIDSGGHYTQEVYDFVQKMYKLRDFRFKAIKGQNYGRLFDESKTAYLKVLANGKPANDSQKLFLINVMIAKTSILESVSFDVKTKNRRNFIHINPLHFPLEFFEQVTSEKKIYKNDKPLFQKIRERNEALDLLAYSYADAHANLVINANDEYFELLKNRNVEIVKDEEKVITQSTKTKPQNFGAINLDDYF